MNTDRTTIKNPRNSDYYAEARDAIMDLCPFYCPAHKGGIVRENVFKDCLQELRLREEVIQEKLDAALKEIETLRVNFTKMDEPRYSGNPMMDAVLGTVNPEFREWVRSIPPTYWSRYDLSAARIGWEAAYDNLHRK